MSVIAMMNFDLSPVSFGTAYNTPTNGSGIEPFVGPYNVSNQAATAGKEVIGVTGREQDKMGGTNSLVVWRDTTGFRPTLTIQPKNQPYLTGTDPFTYTVGFRFKNSSELSSTSFQNGDTLLCIASINNVLSVTSAGLLTFLGGTTGVTLVFDKEYYFEVKMEWVGGATGANFYPVFSLYIDGLFIMSRNVTAFTPGASRIFNVQLGIYRASLGTTTHRSRWLFSDIYLTDGKGDAPYNGQLGPQRVKLIVPDEVVENDWTLTGATATDVIPYLTGAGGRNDTIYLTAPDDDGPATFRFNIPTTAKSVVNGLTFFARAKREDGASRPLLGSIKKADGTELNAVPASTLTTAFVPTLIGQYLPENAAQAANLKDGVLQSMEFTLKAPIA